jgi:hypothetical protein
MWSSAQGAEKCFFVLCDPSTNYDTGIFVYEKYSIYDFWLWFDFRSESIHHREYNSVCHGRGNTTADTSSHLRNVWE